MDFSTPTKSDHQKQQDGAHSICDLCYARYPSRFFRPDRSRPSGLSDYCSKCFAQYVKLKKQFAYAKPLSTIPEPAKVDTFSLIRVVKYQNITLLKHALTFQSQNRNTPFECIAFTPYIDDVVPEKVFHIIFKPASIKGLSAMYMLDYETNEVVHEFAYDKTYKGKLLIRILLMLFHHHRLRLEIDVLEKEETKVQLYL